MPLFFFDIYENGKPSMDRDGVELASLEDARQEARRALAEMASETFRRRDEVSLLIEIRIEPGGKCLEAVATSSIRDIKDPNGQA